MSAQEPVFRVVRGAPTPEEVAALVGVIVMRRPTSTPARRPAGSAWVRAARPGTVSASGMPTRPGVDAWRISGRPR